DASFAGLSAAAHCRCAKLLLQSLTALCDVCLCPLGATISPSNSFQPGIHTTSPIPFFWLSEAWAPPKRQATSRVLALALTKISPDLRLKSSHVVSRPRTHCGPVVQMGCCVALFVPSSLWLSSILGPFHTAAAAENKNEVADRLTPAFLRM
ncbi:hypothetical protein KUCAC02_027060, partial [Chaenocephalus aceratus]